MIVKLSEDQTEGSACTNMIPPLLISEAAPDRISSIMLARSFINYDVKKLNKNERSRVRTLVFRYVLSARKNYSGF